MLHKNLFEHMSEEHGMTLTETELDDIVQAVEYDRAELNSQLWQEIDELRAKLAIKSKNTEGADNDH